MISSKYFLWIIEFLSLDPNPVTRIFPHWPIGFTLYIVIIKSIMDHITKKGVAHIFWVRSWKAAPVFLFPLHYSFRQERRSGNSHQQNQSRISNFGWRRWHYYQNDWHPSAQVDREYFPFAELEISRKRFKLLSLTSSIERKFDFLLTFISRILHFWLLSFNRLTPITSFPTQNSQNSVNWRTEKAFQPPWCVLTIFLIKKYL